MTKYGFPGAVPIAKQEHWYAPSRPSRSCRTTPLTNTFSDSIAALKFLQQRLKNLWTEIVGDTIRLVEPLFLCPPEVVSYLLFAKKLLALFLEIRTHTLSKIADD